MRRSPAFLVLATIGVVAAGATSVAFAATLPVTSTGITTTSTSVSVSPTTCTLNPIADAAIDRSAQGTNYGTVNLLAVRSQSGNAMRRSLVRFNTASCSIPSNAVVRTAVLQVVVSSGPSSSRTYGAHRVGAAWNETTVTYSNQPTFVTGATASISTGTGPATLSWSVLSDVEGFVKGTLVNNGWLVKDSSEGASPGIETIFHSREAATAANRPTLVITYFS